MTKKTKAELERENEELRAKVARLEAEKRAGYPGLPLPMRPAPDYMGPIATFGTTVCPDCGMSPVSVMHSCASNGRKPLLMGVLG